MNNLSKVLLYITAHLNEQFEQGFTVYQSTCEAHGLFLSVVGDAILQLPCAVKYVPNTLRLINEMLHRISWQFDHSR